MIWLLSRLWLEVYIPKWFQRGSSNSPFPRQRARAQRADSRAPRRMRAISAYTGRRSGAGGALVGLWHKWSQSTNKLRPRSRPLPVGRPWRFSRSSGKMYEQIRVSLRYPNSRLQKLSWTVKLWSDLQQNSHSTYPPLLAGTVRHLYNVNVIRC